jgi:hypothetical protein
MKKLLIICLVLMLCAQSVVAVSSMTRSLSATEVEPGDEVTITLSFVEDGEEPSMLLNEIVPEGLEMYEDGKLNDKNNLRKALIDGLTGTVESTGFTYTVKIPPGASGTFTFEGKVTIQSGQADIGGDTTLTVGGGAPPTSAPAAVSPPTASAPVPVFEAQASALSPESAYKEPAYTPPAAAPAPATYTPPAAPEPEYEEPVYEESEPGSEEPAYQAPAAAPQAAPAPAYDAQASAPATGQAYESAGEEGGSKPWLFILLIVGAGAVIGGGIYFAHYQSKNHIAGHMTQSTEFSTQHVKKYIDEYSKLGHSKQQITAHLQKNGIPRQVIEKAHKECAGDKALNQALPHPDNKPEHLEHPGHTEAIDPNKGKPAA